MSRFMKVMVALLAIATLAAPAFAEDRLGLGGQFRLMGWHMDDGGDYTSTYAEQRLRIGGKLSIAEGVSVTFRTDITESNWGSGNTFGSGRTSVGGSNFQSQHWDRAHADLVSGNVHFRGGQQYHAFGKYGFDTQSNGLTFNLKGGVPVTLFYLLKNDGGGTNDADATYFGAKVSRKSDSYSASVFTANQNDGNDENVYMVGTTFDMKMDAVNVATEFEFFTGDASATMDATGLQAMVDVSAAVSGAATVGGTFFYAKSADTNEVQYVLLGDDFGGMDPLFDTVVGLDNEDLSYGRPQDIFGGSNGVIAIRGYATVKAGEALTVGTSVAYALPEEDITGVDSLIGVAVGASYALMPNASLDAKIQYVDNDAKADSELGAGVGLFVNF